MHLASEGPALLFEHLLPFILTGGTKSSEELACDFFLRNDALVREWVPACLTDPPPAGQANIGDSVFLPDED